MTGKRIIFQANKNGFVMPLGKLVSVKEYRDRIAFYKDNVCYLLLLNDAHYCNAILHDILSNLSKHRTAKQL